MSNYFIGVHALQTVPPSNVNRDDTGSPKTAVYGGTVRARVSSQAWKRAVRLKFGELLNKEQLGVRSKHIVALLAERIQEKDPAIGPENAQARATQTLKATGLKLEKPRERPTTRTDAPPPLEQPGYLMFLSAHQIDKLAILAIAAEQAGTKVENKAAREAANQDHSVDVALFGRMVADASDLNVDAAVQVAHALSVHTVKNEFDYFTAVDDRAPKDNAGAGMIGTVEFNSSTLYRYAGINVTGLRENLGDNAATTEAVEAFIRAFVTSMPTGKQATFANRTLPDAIVVTLRQDQPINLVGAFEESVEADETRSRLAVAADRFVEYSQAIDAAYGDGQAVTFVVRVSPATAALDALGEVVTLEELVTRTGANVLGHLQVLA